MLDLENDVDFELALASSLGAPIRPLASARPSTDLRAHLADLVENGAGQAVPVLPSQRVANEMVVS